jgi:hypothetical protein
MARSLTHNRSLAEKHLLRPHGAPVRLFAIAARGGVWNAMVVGSGFAYMRPCCSEREAESHARALFWRAFPKHVCNAGCSSAAGAGTVSPGAGVLRRVRPFILFHLGHFRSLAAGPSGPRIRRPADRMVPSVRRGRPRTYYPRSRTAIPRAAAALAWCCLSAALVWGVSIALGWSTGG